MRKGCWVDQRRPHSHNECRNEQQESPFLGCPCRLATKKLCCKVKMDWIDYVRVQDWKSIVFIDQSRNCFEGVMGES
jgi:hypothetical protein